ncbi:MAG TPA: ribosome maturation factor RimP [Gemmatimonadales bacterium]|nr:ribosome maturation factor RimP [Gemmatimonadales bacterium]
MSPDALQDPIREHVAGLGYELVDLRRAGTLDRPILQLRVDRPDSRPGHGVTAEDCAAISRSLERFLESRALVGPRYVLEVSSPGIERPLRQPDQWRRFVGRKARVRAQGLSGRPEVEIVAVPDEAHVVVRLPDGAERTLALATVEAANLAAEWPAGARPPRGRRHRRS